MNGVQCIHLLVDALVYMMRYYKAWAHVGHRVDTHTASQTQSAAAARVMEWRHNGSILHLSARRSALTYLVGDWLMWFEPVGAPPPPPFPLRPLTEGGDLYCGGGV